MPNKKPGTVTSAELEGDHRTGRTDLDNNIITIRFPVTGYRRSCIQCRHTFRLPWVASTIRDGRTHVCPPCYVDRLKGVN